MIKHTLKNKVKPSISIKNRQTLKILAHSQLKLREHIKNLINENPFLDEVETNNIESELYSSRVNDTFNSRLDRKENLSIENIISSTTTLKEYLLNQLNLIIKEENIKELSSIIISSINEDGFTGIPRERILPKGIFNRKEMSSIVDYFQKIEPLGLGAENIWESLMWQARKIYPKDELIQDILLLLKKMISSFDSINNNVIKSIAEALHIDILVSKKKIEKISRLNLYPAYQFYSKKNMYIYPDVIFKTSKNSYVPVLNEGVIPRVKLNDNLYNEIKSELNDTSWIKKYEEAKDIIFDLQYRSQSLKEFSQFIILKEADFFNKGFEYILPLNLHDASSQLKKHASTISRIIKEKYFQCELGIFSFKIFFKNKIKAIDGGLKSVTSLKKAIENYISKESRTNPYSDEKITLFLQKDGFNMKRRTTAKYRKLLHIPSAKKRKALYSNIKNQK
ncbi:MAG: RNA polymerase factor sigma-54 [Spirochaetia bacterium]|nr:RNA polymerase factor sigma-54 [Spirochaetia bacterium]